MHIFIGQNGQGKTNILEAIYCLSLGKAFRSKTLYESIHFDKEVFHIQAKTDNNTLELHCANSPKKQSRFIVNNAKKSAFEFLGHFFAVLFSPEDLDIIRGVPGIRRDFLDSLLIRLDKQYAYELNYYEKTLKQRNALLKQISDKKASESDLDLWDKGLEKAIIPIRKKRQELLKEMFPLFQKHYHKLSHKNEDLILIMEEKKDSENFLEDLKKRRNKDIILGTTSTGAHRDDFLVLLKNQEAKYFASQGETRSLVLALKLAETEILEKKHQTKVTLLLDDVLSELDEERQQALLEICKERQSFISTTHLKNHFNTQETKVFIVKKGEIKEK